MTQSNTLEYHTNLHHSQTTRLACIVHGPLEYHTNLHHSQTSPCKVGRRRTLEYHTNLHHSQTNQTCDNVVNRLSTILIYIILKLALFPAYHQLSLSTILIYIILKPQIQEDKPHQA